ncbi:MAG: YraN family protein [Pseudomonadota bacterium]
MLYRLRGWRVKNQYGEIDLIFSYGTLYVFVEVKYRKTGIEENTLGYRQINRIRRSAQFYLTQFFQYDNTPMRFDFIIFTPYRLPRIYYNI